MRRFVDRGHDVQVLCSDERVPGAAPIDVAHEARVRRELTMYHRGGELWRPSARECLAVERRNHAALRRAIAEHRPEVVSVWHLAALSLGMLQTVVDAGLPLVYSVCDDWLVYGRRLDAWADRFDGAPWRRLAGRLVGRATGVPTVVPDLGPTGPVLFVTDDTRRRAEEGAPWRFDQTAVVHSGIDGATFPPRPQEPGRRWAWRLAAFGRFDPRKGFETAIRALGSLPPEATLALWGRGGDAERQRLTTIADELGVGARVRFGSLERHELADAYADADAVLFTSEWAEPFGLVPIEAMACGTPVVATGVGGSAEFLRDGGNCLLSPPGDHAALAAAVRRLAGDDRLREHLVEGGRETAAAYDVERLADIMERWHVHVAAGGSGPPPGDRPGLRLPVRPAARVRADRVGATLVLQPEAHAARGAVCEADRLPIRAGALHHAEIDLLGVDADGGRAAAELARVLAPGGTATVVAAGLGDLRRSRDRLRRWWAGDRRPAAPPPAAVPTGWQPPGWEVSGPVAVPWSPGRRAAWVAGALRALRRTRRAPALRFALRRR